MEAKICYEEQTESYTKKLTDLIWNEVHWWKFSEYFEFGELVEQCNEISLETFIILYN